LAICAHKLLAGAVSSTRRAARSTPSTGRASPITTEGGIDDCKVVLEELPRIAGGSRVVGHGLGPGVGERSTVLDVIGDLVAREEVHRDARVIPLHRVDASTGAVEGSAVVIIRGVVLHTATLVASLARSAVGASIEGAECVRVVGGYCAAGTSVDRNLIYGTIVDPLNNVDFTLVRPVGAVAPEGGPSATPDRHVDGIKDEETTIEDVVVVETDRLTIARDGWGGLDAQDGIAGAVDLDELVAPGTILVLEVNGAVGRIGV
jgi:hypothetical protein